MERVLERDPNAIYLVLQDSEDILTYRGGILILSSSGVRVFPSIISLEVESPLDVRRYFRIAAGEFSGFGKRVKYTRLMIVSTFCVCCSSTCHF